jgi:GT2 family glycosyltransferase
MDLSIIIVNWNSVEYLKKCIKSIFSGTKDLSFEIIVIDNASYDGCEEILRREFPKVKYVQSGKNIGFAAANNLGVRIATGKTLLFLNPDTEVIGAAINKMVANLLSAPEAGAIGCRLLNSDLSLQLSCVQPFPTILNQMLGVEWIQKRLPMLKIWGIHPLFYNRGIPKEVEVVSGACLMAKRSIFEEVGMFSTDYFMFTEDVDLCYKIKQAGCRIYFINDAEIIHHGGGSSKKHSIDSFGIILMRESIFKFLCKNRNRTYAQIYKWSFVPISGIRLVITLLLIPIMRPFDQEKRLIQIAKKWVKLLRWSLGMEKWTESLNC